MEQFRGRLAEGRTCLGLAVTFADPAVAEALAPSCDYLWLDLEHSPVGIESLAAQLMAADAAQTAALVRVPGCDPYTIKRVLDSGAEGIIVPQVGTAAEARAIVEACRYTPRGQRGFGPRRGTNYGRQPIGEYTRRAAEQVFVAIQIETAQGYQNLDAILEVPGVDSIVIGPADLSASLGPLGQFDHPVVDEAVRTIIRRSRQAGRWVGIGLGLDAAQIGYYVDLGVNWVMCGCDFLYLVAGVNHVFGEVRAITDQK